MRDPFWTGSSLILRLAVCVAELISPETCKSRAALTLPSPNRDVVQREQRQLLIISSPVLFITIKLDFDKSDVS